VDICFCARKKKVKEMNFKSSSRLPIDLSCGDIPGKDTQLKLNLHPVFVHLKDFAFPSSFSLLVSSSVALLPLPTRNISIIRAIPVLLYFVWLYRIFVEYRVCGPYSCVPAL